MPDSCDTTPTKNGNGWKALAVVPLFFAIVAGVYAMTVPTWQRLDQLEKADAKVEQRLATHEATYGHPLVMSDLATMRESFREVETQFDGDRKLNELQFTLLREDVKGIEVWMDIHDARVREFDAAQWERIKALERNVYGQPQSVVIGP
jgi:hypothetical protein